MKILVAEDELFYRHLLVSTLRDWGYEPEAVDKNFAVHLPVLDWIFGSYYLPNRWPESYGIAGGPKVPEGFLGQLAHPFAGVAR